MPGRERLGPVQVLVVELGSGDRRVIDELRELGEGGEVRLLDLIVLRRRADGGAEVLERGTEPGWRAGAGSLAAALLGLGAAAGLAGAVPEERVWYLEEHVPRGSTVAIALLEHRWAIALREALAAEGDTALADAWVHPRDLLVLGPQGGAR